MFIAFVTCAAVPNLTADDQLAVAVLASRGVRVAPVIWSDASVDWAAFDAVVVRSTWDYHTRPVEFRAWIDRVANVGARLWNPPAVLRWNMQKGYLRDLERAGVPVVPTEWLMRGARPEEASARIDARGWPDVVIKPAISATAFRTWRASSADVVTSHERLRELLAEGDVMIQPFIREIQAHGEWSLVFLGGSFSHAVRKRPREADFRVQSEFGGTAHADVPSDDMLRAAERVLSHVRDPWAYARVDGLQTTDGFVLLELEMLEPSLFLGMDADAPERLADAITRLAQTA